MRKLNTKKTAKKRAAKKTTATRSVGIKRDHKVMEPNPQQLGGALRQTRTRQKMSYTIVADSTNMPPATISKIETGKTKNPGIYTLLRMCDLYEISINTLLDRAKKLPETNG